MVDAFYTAASALPPFSVSDVDIIIIINGQC